MQLFKTISNSITKALHVVDRLVNSMDFLARIIENESELAYTTNVIDSKAQYDALLKEKNMKHDDIKKLIAERA